MGHPVNEPKRTMHVFITTLQPMKPTKAPTRTMMTLRPWTVCGSGQRTPSMTATAYSPTFITLHELTSFPTAASASSAAVTRHVQPIMPVHSRMMPSDW